MRFLDTPTPDVDQAIDRNGFLREAFASAEAKFSTEAVQVVKVLLERALGDQDDYFVATHRHPYIEETKKGYAAKPCPAWIPKGVDEALELLVGDPGVGRELYRQLDVQFVVISNNFKGGLTIRALLTAPGAGYA